MSNDIRDIIERLAILEGRITPTTVKHGLNPQQKSVPQLPALFKPKHISVLGAKKDPKHPMADYMVGASESKEQEDKALAEAQVEEEKLLDKVKKSLTDYLASVEEKLEKKIDKELGEKPQDRELGKKDKRDRDLIAKDKRDEVKEDPTQEDPVQQAATVPDIEPTYAESAPVKTVELHDGVMCEIHGDEHSGFEIRHGNRKMKSRFRSLKEAEMAVEMYRARCRGRDQSADYVDEA